MVEELPVNESELMAVLIGVASVMLASYRYGYLQGYARCRRRERTEIDAIPEVSDEIEAFVWNNKPTASSKSPMPKPNVTRIYG